MINVPLVFQMPRDERYYQPLRSYNSQQNEDAPVDRKHPLCNVLLPRMHSLHTRKFRNALVGYRDNLLYNVIIESGA